MSNLVAELSTPSEIAGSFDGDIIAAKIYAQRAEAAAERAEAAIESLVPDSVDSVADMTDTSKEYVLSSTGTIWVYKNATSTQTFTKTFENTTDETHENPYLPGRLSASSGAYTEYANCLTTPWIDIGEYTGTIKLMFGGLPWIPESGSGTYNVVALYDAEKNLIYWADSYKALSDVWGDNVVWENGYAIVTWTLPKIYSSTTVCYVRVCVRDTTQTTDVANSDISIEYTAEVTGEQWVDTGVKYSGSGVDDSTLAKVSALNNEGSDPETITLLPAPVLEFYNSEAYPDDDYSVTHLANTNYPCRADIPVPFTIKWAHNENAMRTTVAVSTTAIETPKRLAMTFHDATGFDNYPVYNLLPGITYYYQVTHVLSDGSLAVAKSGSFTTSGETWRLLYIEGTQNVRDLGGWTGLDGKTVKYGKIIRGASLSDTSARDFVVTGKGRLALGELKVQAELNLGDTSTETSVSSTCAYKKVGYSNYAVAITSESARANFKTILEWIVSCLDGTLTVTGLSTITRNIYMHCQGGCDRTGTLVFLLLGLLGVSESDLAKEYELSSFSNIGVSRKRNTTLANDTYDYVGLVEALKTYSGDTITDKFVDFATTGCGISTDTIDSFRSLMLE